MLDDARSVDAVPHDTEEFEPGVLARPEGVLLDLASRRAPVPLDMLLAPEGGVLVIAPHPDDETLGCGLAIRAALAAGRDVAVVLLTGGGASHPASRRYPTEALKALRRAEFARALEALETGLDEGAGRLTHRMLDLPDSEVPWAEPSAPLSSVLGEAGDTILRIAQEIGASTLWVTWKGDPHADHGAAGALADAITPRWPDGPPHRRDYAVWGRFGAAGHAVLPERVLPFEAAPHRGAKAAAMDAYASQLTPMIRDDPDGFVMPPALVTHFRDAPEIFLEPRA